MNSIFKIIITLIVMLSSLPAYSREQDAFCSGLLQGKRINLMVPLAPGGTFDLTARALMEPIANRTNVKVGVINNPALGGLLALRGTLEKNSQEIRLAFFSANGLLEVAEKSKLDWVNQLTPLTTYLSEETLWLSKKNGKESIFDYAKFTVSGSIINQLEVKAMAYLFSKQYKLVSGYSGSSEYAAAVLRGEVDFFGPTRMTAKRFMQSGEFQAVIALSDRPALDFPETPYLFGSGSIFSALPGSKMELEKKAAIAKHLIQISRSDRMILIASHHSIELQQCLEKLILESLQDPNFINKVRKLSLKLINEDSRAAKIRLMQTDQSLRFMKKNLP